MTSTSPPPGEESPHRRTVLIPAPVPPPPAKKSRSALREAVVVLVALGFLVSVCGGTYWWFVGEKAEKTPLLVAQLEPGHCVSGGSDSRALGSRHGYRYVDCSLSDDLVVTRVFEGPPEHAQSCPETSAVMLVDAGWIACVDATAAEHRGSPGKGGGVIVAGDCLGSVDGDPDFYRETPCADPFVYEKVTARVDTPTECAAPAVRYSEILRLDSWKVLCLVDGPESAGPGECLGDLDSIESFDSVPCTDEAAGAKLIARKADKRSCESITGVTDWVEDAYGLVPTRFLCLQELR